MPDGGNPSTPRSLGYIVRGWLIVFLCAVIATLSADYATGWWIVAGTGALASSLETIYWIVRKS